MRGEEAGILPTLAAVPDASSSGDALRALGWDDDFASAAADLGEGEPGRVARVDRGVATVLMPAPVRAVIDPSQRDDPGDSATNIATGDWVLVGANEQDEPTITALLPRRSAFVRGDPREGLALGAQVVAANVDTVFVVQALSNGPNLRRLERELVLAYQSGAAPVVVLTKSDLVPDARDIHLALEAVARIAPDVTTLVTSATTTDGVDALRHYSANGRTVALIGASGVGKSTLVNRLVGDDVQATAEVRARDQRGRHTTTARELVPLQTGGVLIDTPGLRAVSLWEADEGVERAFAEIEALGRNCRFSDCRHDQEPGCAVKQAVESGALDAERFASYQRLNGELDRQVAQVDDRARRARSRRSPRPR
ncbi:MAG: rsgA [Actinomycetia bacterium]|nr:rsgA [Actinomycetes bacterium]